MRIDTFTPYRLTFCNWRIDYWYFWYFRILHICINDLIILPDFHFFLSMLYQLLTEKNVPCCFLFGILSNSQNLVSLYGYKDFCVVLFCFIAIMTNFELQIINMQVSNVSYPKMKSIFEVKNQKILIWTSAFNSAPLFSHYFYYQQYLECANTVFNY